MSKKIYVFIDGQNLYRSTRSSGWRLDYRKFRLYLTNKHGVSKAFMFLGFSAHNQQLYKRLKAAGFILIFKPVVRHVQDGKEVFKGNIDAELVLHAAAIEYAHYSKAIIVSGDGDFACLIKFLLRRNKLANILVPNKNYSSLLAPYLPYVIRVDAVAASFGKREDPSN